MLSWAIEKSFFDKGIDAKKSDLRRKQAIDQDRVERERSKFQSKLTNDYGVYGISLSSPAYQKALAEGNKVISEAELNEQKLLAVQLSKLNDQSDYWWAEKKLPEVEALLMKYSTTADPSSLGFNTGGSDADF